MKRVFLLLLFCSMVFAGFTVAPQDPLTVMGQEVNKVKKGGVSSISSQVTSFSEGQEFTADAVARVAGVNLGKVEFCCGNVNDVDGKCVGYEIDVPNVECSPDSFIVVKDMVIRIRAYCPLNSSYPCVIGFKQDRGTSLDHGYTEPIHASYITLAIMGVFILIGIGFFVRRTSFAQKFLGEVKPMRWIDWVAILFLLGIALFLFIVSISFV